MTINFNKAEFVLSATTQNAFIRDGRPQVTFAGRSNVGKSSVINRLLNRKNFARVGATPGKTTQVNYFLIDNRVYLTDLPGYGYAKVSKEERERWGRLMESYFQAPGLITLGVLIVDARHKPTADDCTMAQWFKDTGRPMVVVANKVDLFADKSRMLPLLTRLNEMWPRAEIFPVSALNKDGLPELAKLIKKQLPKGIAQFPEDQISTAPVRFMAAEIVREKLFLHLRQEVPYGIAVEVENWDEDPEREQTIIHAVIYVARPMHKGMVIGRGGSVLKQVGMEARQDIRELIGGKVHLELWVKVRENWTEDTAFLRELGMGAESL